MVCSHPPRAPACRVPSRGLVLMDLSFAHRIDTDLEKLVINDPTPTGNPMLDRTLARLAAHDRDLNTRTWIKVLSVEDAASIRERALQNLVACGILELREESFLWAFRPLGHPRMADGAEQEVKQRIRDILFSDSIPAPRDAALIGLADACDLLGHIFSDKDMSQHRTRTDQLRKMDLIARELAGAISDIERTAKNVLLDQKD